MDRTIPEDVLELAKPAIGKRIGELVEAAFKLADFAACPDILEQAIDGCSSRYFVKGAENRFQVEDENPRESSTVRKPPARVGTNIVVSSSHTACPQHSSKSRHGRRDGKPGGYYPHELVKAANYSRLGRPLSLYRGVTYSGSLSSPWVVRYCGRNLGRYKDEAEAARVYDNALRKDGKEPVNFSS